MPRARADTPMLTSLDLASRWAVKVTAVHEWVRNGQIPRPFRTPGGRMRWRLEDIEKFERERREGGA